MPSSGTIRKSRKNLGGVKCDLPMDEVLYMREMGMSYKKIGDHFGVSDVTISKYIKLYNEGKI